MGYADASKGRSFGSSLGADEAEHADLVGETLEDLPPEARGLRDEWARKTGVGRREPVRGVHVE